MAEIEHHCDTGVSRVTFSANNGSVGIYSTGNPVHLPNPNPYPACVLTNPNFQCHVFQLTNYVANSVPSGLV